jgi:hypothetical protein
MSIRSINCTQWLNERDVWAEARLGRRAMKLLPIHELTRKLKGAEWTTSSDIRWRHCGHRNRRLRAASSRCLQTGMADEMVSDVAPAGSAIIQIDGLLIDHEPVPVAARFL